MLVVDHSIKPGLLFRCCTDNGCPSRNRLYEP
jgi:hypothetical protein